MYKMRIEYKYKGYNIFRTTMGWKVVSYAKDFPDKMFKTLMEAKNFISDFLMK